MSFCSLGLGPETLKALAEVGYTTPTPIQAQAIPVVFMGRDVLGIAQTGTGKTASFSLPMIEILAQGRTRARMPRALILTPTRELSAQVAKSFARYGCYHRLSMALLVGGESVTAQIRLLDRGVDVLIATPGRLLDLFQRGHVLLSDVRILVIDEADRMLDMGFIPDVERIVTLLPRRRQTLFFSATMSSEVKRLADVFLNEPREIHAAPPAQPADGVIQSLVVVDSHAKDEVLRYFLRKEGVRSAFIFCNRKRDICVLHRSLVKHGFPAGMLHGDLLQSLRTDTLEQFKSGEISLLVCSDVAARGIDITALSHVVNFDVPIHAEDYIHRIGRTGRAGMSGHALTIAVPEDSNYVVAIEKLIGHQIPRLIVNAMEEIERVRERRKRRKKTNRTCIEHAQDRENDKQQDRGSQACWENDSRSPLQDDGTGVPTMGHSENVLGFDSHVPALQDDGTGVPTMGHSEDVLGFGSHVPAFFLVNALENLTNVSEYAGRKEVSLSGSHVKSTDCGTTAGEIESETSILAQVPERVTPSAEQVGTEQQGTEEREASETIDTITIPSETIPSETVVRKRGRPRKGSSDDSAGTSLKRGRSQKKTNSPESRATITRRLRKTPIHEGIKGMAETSGAPSRTRRTKTGAPDRANIGEKQATDVSHSSAVSSPKISGEQRDSSSEPEQE